MIIAIDGYSACGKSTIAKSVAKFLKIHYVDSGAVYRAIAYYCLLNQIDPTQELKVVEALALIHIKLLPEVPIRIELNGIDVSEEIRSLEVSNIVSEISIIGEVRKKVVALLRSFGKDFSLVMDGRDIGSVVFPDAEYKFFVTADPNVRAQRRFKELQEKGMQISFEEVLNNLHHRDFLDSTREDSPLVKTADSFEIDTTHLNLEQQLAVVLRYIGH
ncbi:MAG: (d)CMP kinase [Saprospiraceae bacterium]|nr:(d)CMP kinase [Saprospiraceae bacterium]MBK9631544.1 (d)CMP kinase [Saprospiraceae bacterium]